VGLIGVNGQWAEKIIELQVTEFVSAVTELDCPPEGPSPPGVMAQTRSPPEKAHDRSHHEI